MKKEKHLILLMLILPISVFPQKTKCTTDTIMHYEINLDLPAGYKRDYLAYGEGAFLSYFYQDSTIINVFSGKLQRLPLLHEDRGYFVCKIDSTDGVIRRSGKKDGKYWREDDYKNIRIYYDNIKMNDIWRYDKILNNFQFKQTTRSNQ